MKFKSFITEATQQEISALLDRDRKLDVEKDRAEILQVLSVKEGPDALYQVLAKLTDAAGRTQEVHKQGDPMTLPTITHNHQMAAKALLVKVVNALPPEQKAEKLKKYVDLDKLKRLLGSSLDKNQAAQLGLKLNKVTRSKAQRKFDRENETFVFIARPGFVETPKGSGNYKKSLEIENMHKVDAHDLRSHRDVQMMNMRARFQGEGSQVYMVTLPVGTIKGGESSRHLEPWLINLIDEHKKLIH